MDVNSYAAHPEDFDVPHFTFGTPDLTTLCYLKELGFEAVGQCIASDRAVIECRVAGSDSWC